MLMIIGGAGSVESENDELDTTAPEQVDIVSVD
jgi:hypothetical protein